MKHQVSESDKACLHFRQYGKGEKVLLCFHGFGQDHQVYRILEDRFGNDYTIFSFDLFYHGQSFWHNKSMPISLKDWEQIIGQFIKEQEIKQFSVVGYSMGARFALALYNMMPKRITQLILVAPDGITKRFTYWFMTSFGINRKILRYLVTKPQPYKHVLDILLRFRLIDKRVLKFSETQMQTRALRRKVYYSWVMFRNLYVPIGATTQKIQENNTKLKLVMGVFDKVIDLEDIRPLLKTFPESLMHLPVGHTGLLKAWVNTPEPF